MSSGITSSPERLSEVSRLAALLADRALDAHIESRPIPEDQVRALVDAALLLDAYGQALPPLVGQVLHEVGPKPAAARGQAHRDADEIGRLAWMLRPFRSAKERN